MAFTREDAERDVDKGSCLTEGLGDGLRFPDKIGTRGSRTVTGEPAIRRPPR
jgi:hypothetical protein